MSELIAEKKFSCERDARRYVSLCEQQFSEQVRRVADEISALESCRFLGLGGPSCAGKSTMAKHLIAQLEAAGKHVHIISIDNFFREQPNIRAAQSADPFRTSVDLDSIDALDLPLFCRFVEQLMTIGQATMPLYDLSVGRRNGEREYRVNDEGDLFLFEGIQTVYPDISQLLSAYPYFSMFVCVRRAIRLGEHTIEPNRIRLLRRLVRDYYRRASSPEFTLFLWDSVRANEEQSIFPNAMTCRAQLDSTMGYEIGMLRPYLEKILPPLLSSSDYGPIAAAILQDISVAEPLPASLLPPTALYREFVDPQQTL